MEKESGTAGTMRREGKGKGQAGPERQSLDLFREEQGRGPEAGQSLSDNEWAALMGERENMELFSSSSTGGGQNGDAKGVEEKTEPDKGRSGRGRRIGLVGFGTPALPAALAALGIALAAVVYGSLILAALRERVDRLERLTPVLEKLVPHEEAMAALRKEIEAAVLQAKESQGGTAQAVGEGEGAKPAAGLDELRARVDAVEARLREQGAVPPPSGSPQAMVEPAPGKSQAEKSVLAAGARKARTARAEPPATVGGGGRWSVNLGSFRERQAADSLAGKVKAAGYAAVVREVSVGDGTWHRVSIAGIASEEEARRINAEIGRKIGTTDGWVHRN